MFFPLLACFGDTSSGSPFDRSPNGSGVRIRLDLAEASPQRDVFLPAPGRRPVGVYLAPRLARSLALSPVERPGGKVGAPGECGRSHNTSMDHELPAKQTLGRLVAGRTHAQRSLFPPLVEWGTSILNGGGVQRADHRWSSVGGGAAAGAPTG